MDKKIPSIIHQTAEDWKSLNEDFKNNIKDLQEKNPNWNYKFYNKSDRVQYIKRNFPDLLRFYEAIDGNNYGAARADFFRYCVLYNEGGVYLDIKSNVNKSLDDIINKEDEFVWQSGRAQNWDLRNRIKNIGREDKQSEIMQWFICTRAKHPFLWNVLEAIKKEMQKEKYLISREYDDIFDLTGPHIYSKVIYGMMDDNLYPHRELDTNDKSFIYNKVNKHYSHSIGKPTYHGIKTPVLKYKPNLNVIENFSVNNFECSSIGIK